jgi:hypothetical protein
MHFRIDSNASFEVVTYRRVPALIEIPVHTASTLWFMYNAVIPNKIFGQWLLNYDFILHFVLGCWQLWHSIHI